MRGVRTVRVVWVRAACAGLLLACSACTTPRQLGEGMGNMADKALETIGFKKPELPKPPELPESAKPPRLVRLQVSASDSLNLDPQGHSLALVVRVYKLRAPTSFLNAPLEAFGDSAREKQAMGEDLIDVKELTLSPGFRRELSEKWAREAGYMGVAGLFMAPAPQRWRYVFDVAEPIDQPFLIGAHSCALSVGVGTPIGIPEYTQRVLPADCAPPGSLVQQVPRSNKSSSSRN